MEVNSHIRVASALPQVSIGQVRIGQDRYESTGWDRIAGRRAILDITTPLSGIDPLQPSPQLDKAQSNNCFNADYNSHLTHCLHVQQQFTNIILLLSSQLFSQTIVYVVYVLARVTKILSFWDRRQKSSKLTFIFT